jgi:hypothetical protein
MKTCSKCQQVKSLNEFNKNQAKCKPCQYEYQKLYYRQNPEQLKKHTKNYRLNNPEKYKQIIKNYSQSLNHKISVEKYQTSIKCVYGIFSDNICLYVGQSKRYVSRKNKHLNFIKNIDKAEKYAASQKYLYPLLRQHENIQICIIEECSVNKLLQQEQYYINAYKPLYNDKLN